MSITLAGLDHPVQAIIFDMDGLMLDTERLAQQAWQQAAAQSGYQAGPQVFLGVIGKALPDVYRALLEAFGERFPFDEVYQRKRELYDRWLKERGVPVKPGLPELLNYLEGLEIPLAVASSSLRQNVHRNLAAAGTPPGTFAAVIAGDEIERGKPAPDIFLAVGNRLALPPEACLVLEDSPAGIRAAAAAGMVPVMVPDLIPADAQTARLAWQVLPDLTAVQALLETGQLSNDTTGHTFWE